MSPAPASVSGGTQMDDDADGPMAVLLVEDNDGDAELVAFHLRRTAWYPTSLSRAGSLDAARSLLDRVTFDSVLVDLGLPDSDGLETLRSVRVAAADTPVVVLTGRADDDLGPRVIEEGAEDFVPKGMEASTLVRALRFAVTRARHRRAVLDYERRLIHADRLAALGQLAAGVAHEINNPAAFITANVDEMGRLLRELAVAPVTDGQAKLDELAEMLDECQQGIRRIHAITRDLGAFSRISSDETERVDLNDVIRSAINLTRNEVRHIARIELELTDLPPIVADKAKLTQVFVNLLINAAQAMADTSKTNHRIRVVTRRDDGLLVATVQDTGGGITQEHLTRVFDPFFTTKPADRGTGLGLAICNDTVRRHGGEIHVDTVAGVGTTFEIRIPEDTGLSPTHSPMSPPPAAAPTPPARLLLIDDDAVVRRSLSRVLRRHHTVEGVDGGKAALSALRPDAPYDVILCDLMMPDVDGAAVLDHIKENAPALEDRIIFISGGAFTPRSSKVVDSGHLVIEKPVDQAKLLAAIARVAAKKHRLG
ncbi:MAG: response regulator [Polyangiaceae bacterium]